MLSLLSVEIAAIFVGRICCRYCQYRMKTVPESSTKCKEFLQERRRVERGSGARTCRAQTINISYLSVKLWKWNLFTFGTFGFLTEVWLSILVSGMWGCVCVCGGEGEPLTQPYGVTCLKTFAVLVYRSGSRQRLYSLNYVTDGSCKLLQITIILLRILQY